MRTRSTLICSVSALFCASSSTSSSFRLSLSSESSVSGGIPNLNQPPVMRSMPKARVKPRRGVSNYEYFDAKRNWRKIKPHLKDKELNDVLVRDFRKYLSTNRSASWPHPFTHGKFPPDYEN